MDPGTKLQQSSTKARASLTQYTAGVRWRGGGPHTRKSRLNPVTVSSTEPTLKFTLPKHYATLLFQHLCFHFPKIKACFLSQSAYQRSTQTEIKLLFHNIKIDGDISHLQYLQFKIKTFYINILTWMEIFFYYFSNIVLSFIQFSTRTTGSVTNQLHLTFLMWKNFCAIVMSLKSCNLQKTTPSSAIQVTSPSPLPRLTRWEKGDPIETVPVCLLPPFPPSTGFLLFPFCKADDFFTCCRRSRNKDSLPKVYGGESQQERRKYRRSLTYCIHGYEYQTQLSCTHISRERFAASAMHKIVHEGQFNPQTPEPAALGNVTMNCPDFVPCIGQTLH